MGAQSPVALTEASPPATVLGDQAIFTSVFSHTGEGYRIVAASAGLQVDERREITQRSPSHGSLCGEAPDRLAVSVYPLASGRFCVAHSRHAGFEHTARGGQRVHTHAVVLTDADLRRFQCNPLRVHASLAAAIPDQPVVKPPLRLDPLCLTVSPASPWGTVTAPPADMNAEQICALLSLLLAGERVVVVGAGYSHAAFEWTIMALPLCARRTVAGSVGLKFSPGRQMRLTFIGRNQREAQRAISGHGIRWFDVASAQRPEPSAFDSWLEVIGRWWSQRRHGEISGLASQIIQDASPRALRRIAAVCEDIDRVQTAGEAMLAALVRKYAAFAVAGEPEADLVRRFREAADRRAQLLSASP